MAHRAAKTRSHWKSGLLRPETCASAPRTKPSGRGAAALVTTASGSGHGTAPPPPEKIPTGLLAGGRCRTAAPRDGAPRGGGVPLPWPFLPPGVPFAARHPGPGRPCPYHTGRRTTGTHLPNGRGTPAAGRSAAGTDTPAASPPPRPAARASRPPAPPPAPGHRPLPRRLGCHGTARNRAATAAARQPLPRHTPDSHSTPPSTPPQVAPPARPARAGQATLRPPPPAHPAQTGRTSPHVLPPAHPHRAGLLRPGAGPGTPALAQRARHPYRPGAWAGAGRDGTGGPEPAVLPP